MSKPDFEKCTVEATKFLYRQDVSDRILNIQRLNYDKNIIFESIQNYCQLTHTPLFYFLSEEKQMLNDGCTIYVPENDLYIILYNADMRCFEHLNWTLAHEIGHIYLGHTKDDDLEEVEAHYFAAQLFMPDFSLNKMNYERGELSVTDITEIFGVSPEAAQKRIETMKKRKCIYFSACEKEIWSIQKERVDMYFECLRGGYNFRNTLAYWQEMKCDCEREHRLSAYAQMH